MRSPVYLLETKFFAVNMNDALEEVIRYLPNRRGEYFCFANIHLVMEAIRNPNIMNILNQSAGTFPDGMGVALALKFLNYKFRNRVRGTDFTIKMCEYAAHRNLKVFLYGNTEEVLRLLKEKLKTVFPGINVVGSISPPFRPLTKEEDERIVRYINELDPNILFVSLGAPKQEKWMAEHKGKIKSLQFGVGAAFDFIVEKVRQAPRWMQTLGLEWLFRLPQQPNKTITRMKLVPEFALRTFVQFLGKNDTKKA
jgi:N-acetylglucosaminyldiphosphoundecaprenol N-acetyl-beta-D-mannosaminyltransferase